MAIFIIERRRSASTQSRSIRAVAEDSAIEEPDSGVRLHQLDARCRGRAACFRLDQHQGIG
jgi:hypothetical protein